MCNLYALTTSHEAMRAVFGFEPRQLNLPVYPAIFPGNDAPVVKLGEDGGRELTIMSWGFVLPQKDKAPKRVTNARDNKVAESPFWRNSFEERRCLVPASSFAEPKGRKPAVWHWFGIKGDEPRPVFAFAGIWRPWKGYLKDELVELKVMSFLTTTPNSVVKPIHPNRMPVILHPKDYEAWLKGTPGDALELAKPYPAENMHIVHKGEKKDDPSDVV